MENFSSDEISKLEQFKKLFKVDSLTTDQIQAILGRKIEVKTEKVKKAVKVRCRPTSMTHI